MISALLSPRLRSCAGEYSGGSFYQEQYENTFGCAKLLLFIDGVDELTEKGQDILLELPEPEEIPENVYIVLTCRAEKEEVLPAVLDFTERYPFTDQVEFDCIFRPLKPTCTDF